MNVIGLQLLQSLREEMEQVGAIVDTEFGKLSEKQGQTPLATIANDTTAHFKQWATAQGIGFAGSKHENNELVLSISTIDGEGAFLRGMATSTIAATVLRMNAEGYGEPLVAIIHNPVTKEFWWAQNGYGAYYTRGENEPQKVSVAHTPPQPWYINMHSQATETDRVYLAVVGIVKSNVRVFSDQQMGAFAIGGGLIARGLLHATATRMKRANETAPMSLIVREAGGVAINLHSKDLTRFKLKDQGFVQSTGAIFACNKDVAFAISKLYA